MIYSPILVIHILGGIVGLLSGYVALFVRKGGNRHRQAGNIFVVSMLVMAAAGAYVSILHHQKLNVLAGTFTFYLVGTAWLTVQRKVDEIGYAEAGLLLVGLSIGITGWVFSRAATGPSARMMYGVFGTLALLACAGDIRLLLRRGIAGGRRLARHLWRMCAALLIAATSFFIGTAGDPTFRRVGIRARLFPQSVRDTHLPLVPVFLVLGAMIFWLIRVRVAKQYRTPARPLAAEVPQ